MADLASFTASWTTRRRFNLDAIAGTLRALQRAYPRVNPALKDRRDPLDDDVIHNMLAGYAMVDGLVADGVDLFGHGQLKSWLDINALVLCGDDAIHPERVADHLQATEERFYDDANGGIRDIMEWNERARHQSVWKRAAGVYIRMVSEPQLFPDGNHRSGVLVMSYMLAREGHPPVVLTPENATPFFDQSTTIKQMLKGSLAMMVGMTGLKRRLAEFLKDQAGDTYLLPTR